MAFTRTGGVEAGSQSKALQDQGISGLELPSDELASRTPQPFVQQGDVLDDVPTATPFEQGLNEYIDAQAAAESQAAQAQGKAPLLDEGSIFEQGEWLRIEEQQRLMEEAPEDLANERITPITERRQEQRVDQWRAKASTAELPSADQGISDRLRAVSQSLGYYNRDRATGAVTYIDPVSAIGKTSAIGRLMANMQAAQPDVTTGKYIVDPVFKQILGMTTEQYFAEKITGNNKAFETDLRPIRSEDNLAEYGSEVEQDAQGGGQPTLTVNKADDPTRLGQEIHREYQRVINSQAGLPSDQYTDLPREEAARLGDFAKEIFAFSMGDDMPLYQDTSGKTVYSISPNLAKQFADSKAYRDTLFKKNIVKPLKAPSKTGKAIGEGQKTRKSETGKIGKGRTTSREHEEARRNQASVPHVVDKTRLKILLSTLLPALMNGPQKFGQDELQDILANINNIGPDKYQQFVAASNIKNSKLLANEAPYNPQEELRTLKQIIAQQLFGISQERQGANYLTYVIQAFNGRFTPQQTLFNPTTSKAVRFVTRNAVPSEIRKNGKNYNAALQAYALVLGIEVRGVDANGKATFGSIDNYEPKIRAQTVLNNASQFEEWGNRLIAVMNDTMSDDDAEAVAAAIANGVPLQDPNFPKVQGIKLDPEKDSLLIQAIAKKGEDGNAFIDALMDFAKFQAAMRRGVPHYSYLNPTIDGKTNGPASNALQMGDREGALRTGVIRTEDQVYAVQDDEDIRDVLKKILIGQLDEGFTGHFKDPESDFVLSLIARSVFSTRDLNKKITMTFGYGKEIESFIPEVIQVIQENALNDPMMAAALQYLEHPKTEINMASAATVLVNAYVPAVKQVMSADGIESRRVMWGTALANAMAETVFEIEGPTGSIYRYGGNMADPDLTVRVGQYKMKDPRFPKGERGVNVEMYDSSPTSSAPKSRTSRERIPESGEIVEVTTEDVGGRAWGGAIPGPVQAIDAATVARTFSGQSWSRIKKAAGGNPYVFQVYDAFKFDINSFERGYLEVNKNWAEISLGWSYLAEGQKSLVKAVASFEDKVKAIKGDKVNLSDFPMIQALIQLEINNNGDLTPALLTRKLKSIAPDFANRKEKQIWADKTAKRILHNSGIVGTETELTKKQILSFYKYVMKATKLPQRMQSLYERTEKNKAELRKEVFDPSNTIMQYHAH